MKAKGTDMAEIDLGEYAPLIPAVDLKVNLNTINSAVDIHNGIVNTYLKGSYTSATDYGTGSSPYDKPEPAYLSWSYDNGEIAKFEIEVSENDDMTEAWVFNTDNNYFNLYNLKSGTKYYWRITAEYKNRESYKSDVSSFETKDGAPRMIYADGMRNMRDVGGWQAGDKKVKQGLIYRSFCLDYDGTTYITDSGIDTLLNYLGIKTEIDLRNEVDKTSSILGSGVNYYHCGMNYINDFLSDNKTAIKNIFEVFADESNYPIIYHCMAGADRTGTITYILNGLLGVCKEDLIRDYLLTNLAPIDGLGRPFETIADKYVKTLDEYTGNSLSEKIYNYLENEIGISSEKLDNIIELMIE